MEFVASDRFYYSENDFINYHTSGRGSTTLVFLHGFGASLQTWRDLVQYIPKEEFSIYLLDLKGSGFSSKPKNSDYSMPAIAKIVSAFINQKGIKDYILVGHSFGGGVALLTAIEFRSDIAFKPRALVLLDAAAYKTELPFFVEYLRIPIISSLMLMFTSADFQARYTLDRIYFDKSKVTPDMVRRYSFFIRHDGYNYAIIQTAKHIVPKDFEQYTNRYRELDMPSLVIWGKQDPALPISSGERLVRELPNAKLEVIDSCGHNPQEEWPDKTAELILSFIAGLGE